MARASVLPFLYTGSIRLTSPHGVDSTLNWTFNPFNHGLRLSKIDRKSDDYPSQVAFSLRTT